MVRGSRASPHGPFSSILRETRRFTSCTRKPSDTSVWNHERQSGHSLEKKTHVQNWQQLGGRHSSFQIRWLSTSTKSGGMEVSLVVSSAPVQRDPERKGKNILFTLGLILAGGEWNSHIGRFAPDVWLSYLCGTHKLNTPTFRYVREIGERMMAGCCFHVD